MGRRRRRPAEEDAEPAGDGRTIPLWFQVAFPALAAALPIGLVVAPAFTAMALVKTYVAIRHGGRARPQDDDDAQPT